MKKSDKEFSALGLAWELGYTIAVPLVALALLGTLARQKTGDKSVAVASRNPDFHRGQLLGRLQKNAGHNRRNRDIMFK